MDGETAYLQSNAAAEQKKKMFLTTSDIMKRMNAAIKESDNELASDTFGFELQRKLPDGSHRPASAAEVAAADFQTKMKQAADMVAMLPPSQKLQWAKHQRKEGNKLFAAEEYKDAMDVYLTCLVAMDQSSKKSDSNEEEECNPIPTSQIEEELKLPVLLNLALCALKLGMLSKAEKFCNYAIEMEAGKCSVKANFRRGRSRMLMGNYEYAKLDLTRALELNNEMCNTEDCDSIVAQSEREAILRELEKLDRLVTQAEKNKAKQKKAMKRMFQSTSKEADDDLSLGNVTKNNGLYPEKKAPEKLLMEDALQEEEYQLSCFEWYVRMIGRCAQKLLDIIGEEDATSKDEEGIPVDQQLVEQFLNNAKKNV